MPDGSLADQPRRRIAVIGPGDADAHIRQLAQQVGQFLGGRAATCTPAGLVV